MCATKFRAYVRTIGSMLQSQTNLVNPCLLQLSMSVCGLSLGQVARASHLSRIGLLLGTANPGILGNLRQP